MSRGLSGAELEDDLPHVGIARLCGLGFFLGLSLKMIHLTLASQRLCGLGFFFGAELADDARHVGRQTFGADSLTNILLRH